MIDPVDENLPIPEGAKCQEASAHSRSIYIACGRDAVAMIRHDKDNRSYYMCDLCASHNLHNRGGKIMKLIDDPNNIWVQYAKEKYGQPNN